MGFPITSGSALAGLRQKKEQTRNRNEAVLQAEPLADWITNDFN
jgi:hypothetical protein